MNNLISKLRKVGLAALLLLPMSQAHAVAVDLELILLVDVSGSVDATDYNIQKTGYVNAFNNAAVVNAIESGAIGSIAATLVYWSDGQSQSVGWTEINDAASASAFATAINVAPRPFSGGTGMTDALNFATGLVTANNGFEGTRTAIDISGDGSDSNDCNFTNLNCVPLQNARDGALAAGVNTINALWIEDSPYFCDGGGCTISPTAYGTTNVIGGTNANGSPAFQTVVAGFDDFGAAIVEKLVAEINPTPEPSILALLGIGFAGISLMRKRRHQES